MMKMAVLGIFVLVSIGSARADEFTDARAKYDSGNYPAAINELRPIAESGDARAQNLIGVMYVLGKGLQADANQGAAWILRSASQGDADAQDNLGRLYYYGQGVNKDYAESVRWFLRAAEKGNGHAQYRLGVAYEHGLGVRKNVSEAVRWYRSAATGGHSDATKALAEFEERTRLQAKYDAISGKYADYVALRDNGMHEGACLLGYKLAIQGDIEAQSAFGEQLILPSACKSVLNSIYVPEAVWDKHAFPEDDILESTKGTWTARGLEFLARAAASGNSEAQSWMGRVYGPIEFETVVVQSWQKSELWLQKSAEGGSRSGAYYYARYLDEKKNDQGAAARWYLYAAQNGIFVAQREMAYRYNSGNGVPKDPDQVGYWLTQLAEQTTHPGMRKWARRQLGYR